MKSVHIDRAKRLKDQPATGHNRFHPDITPIVAVEEGEDVVLETRDGVDGQFGPATTEADMAIMQPGAIHPLTGPVFVKGAQPGDVLEVEFLDIVPQPQVRVWTARENDLMARGGVVFPPDATEAVPNRGPAASEGLRTLPPRGNGGNFDVKQLTRGSKLRLPVAVSPSGSDRPAAVSR